MANQKRCSGPVSKSEVEFLTDSYDVKHIDMEFLDPINYICSDDVITLQQVSHDHDIEIMWLPLQLDVGATFSCIIIMLMVGRSTGVFVESD